MLVAHDSIETDLVGQGVLLMVFVVMDVGLFRVEMGVGKSQ